METKKLLNKIKNLLITLVFVGLMVYLLENYSYKGFAGYVLFIMLIFSFQIFRNRKAFSEHFMNSMRMVETTMFGKPLDKDLWDKGEIKKTKRVVKIGIFRISLPLMIILLLILMGVLFVGVLFLIAKVIVIIIF